MMLKNLHAETSTSGSVVLTKNGETLETLQLIPADQRHRSFILSTWVRSAQPLITKLLGVPKSTFLAEEPRIAESRFDTQPELFKVLTQEEDDGFVVLGWICGSSDGVLHHIYVVPEFRGIGLGRVLIEQVCGRNVQINRPWPFPNTPKGLTFQWNPYSLSK